MDAKLLLKGNWFKKIKTLKINFPSLYDTTLSGSPIIQNGKIIGAVTHVFINDPTKGYGILIDDMLEEAGLLQGEASGLSA